MRLNYLIIKIFSFIFFCLPVFADTNSSCDYNATKIADNLNIAYQDYNFLMALSGILVGFLILFFSIKLVTK